MTSTQLHTSKLIKFTNTLSEPLLNLQQQLTRLSTLHNSPLDCDEITIAGLVKCNLADILRPFLQSHEIVVEQQMSQCQLEQIVGEEPACAYVGCRYRRLIQSAKDGCCQTALMRCKESGS